MLLTSPQNRRTAPWGHKHLPWTLWEAGGTPSKARQRPVPLSTTPRSPQHSGLGGVTRGVGRGANRGVCGGKSCHSLPGALKRRGDPHAASPQKTTPGVPPQNASSRGFSPQAASWAAAPSPHRLRAPPRLRPSSPLPGLPAALPGPPRRYLPCRARREPRTAARGPHRDTDQTKGAAILAPGGSGVSLLRPPAARGGAGRGACAGGSGDAGHVGPPGFPPVPPEPP